MLNFFKKPLGYAIIILMHGIISNQVYYQFFPTPQMPPTFSMPMIVWMVVSFYVFLTTIMLYRLLIKQEPFSKEFKKAASKYHTVITVIYTGAMMSGAKILYEANPALAQKLVATNVIQFINLYGWFLMLIVMSVGIGIMLPLIYWVNYGLLSLTNKIVNWFLKSKEV